MATTGRTPTVFRPPTGITAIFFVVLGLWLVFPVVLQGNLAQDAVPYLVAGELVRTQPDAIYATQARDLYDLPPAFARRSCELSPAGTDCGDLNVAFVSAPQALPFAVLLTAFGPSGGVFLARLLAALALSGGMWALWRRLAHRTARAGGYLVATVVLLTPFTMLPLPLGQTSPFLFLSACVGVKAADRRWWAAALVAGLWSLTISLKLFPLALVAVLLWQRRFALVGWSAAWLAVLTALALALGPPELFGQFATATRVLGGFATQNPYNGSFDAVVHALAPASSGTTAVEAVSLGVRLSVAGALGWFAVRRADADLQWSWAWLAVLLFVPLVWWHYLWLAVAALAVGVAAQHRVDDRLLLILPVAAAGTVVCGLANGGGGVEAVLRFAFLAGALGVTTWLAYRSSREVAPAAGRSIAAAPAGR